MLVKVCTASSLRPLARKKIKEGGGLKHVCGFLTTSKRFCLDWGGGGGAPPSLSLDSVPSTLYSM